MDAKAWADLCGPLVAALIAGGVAAILVPWAQDRWEKVKKHRELDLEALREFHRLYGEFVSAWKLWNTPFRQPDKWQMSTELAEDCLRHATAVEGGFESLLVKVAAERQLGDSEIDVLGATRQAFQALRDVVRRRLELEWGSSEERHYVAMKTLAAYTYVLLAKTPRLDSQPSNEEAATNLRKITSNDYEERGYKSWVEIGNQLAPAAVTDPKGSPAISR
jgi:hypothetical protein